MRSDEELVLAIRGGDMGAFDALYRRYADRLYGYIFRSVGDRATADDLFQEVMLAVLADEKTVVREGRFAGWLFTVARNRCVSLHRQRALHELKLAATKVVPASTAAPSAGAERLVLQEALGSLPEPQREALLLKALGQLSYREIAAVQDVPEGTAKSRLHFAIAALRRLFGT